jgi:hypothetical protein
MPTINTDKVCFIVVKARELESEDEGVQADASNATDDGFVSVLTEEAFSTVRNEVASFIDAMDVDEQAELVALMWVGRGEFSAEEWKEAVTQARGMKARLQPICLAFRSSPPFSRAASPNLARAASFTRRIGSDGRRDK